MHSTRFDITAIGEPMIEFNQSQPGGRQYLQGFGGDTSNMLLAAARQGARAAYVTRVGGDEFGALLLKLWEQEGVNTEAVKVDPTAHTGVYFVTHGESGHSFSYLRAGSAASRLCEDDLPLDLIRSSKFVHASGISLAISSSAADCVLSAFEAARSAGTQVAFDGNLRLKLWPLARARAVIGAAMAVTDYFFPSLEDAQALSGLSDDDAIIDWAHRLGPRIVVLKLGARGVVVSDGARRDHITGFKVETVDATGAGDCFCGSMLARLSAGDSLLDAALHANAAAALATTGYGAVAPLPTLSEVRHLLASRRPNVPQMTSSIEERHSAG